jgi:hypothetical protein
VAPPRPHDEADAKAAALEQDCERLRRERDALLSERDVLLSHRDTTHSEADPAARAAAALRSHPVEVPALQPDAGWPRRIAAVAFLLACLIALAIITHVL